ncbi:hypothetical protein ABIA43_006814 [Bradyrhizobium sp. USDA 328]
MRDETPDQLQRLSIGAWKHQDISLLDDLRGGEQHGGDRGHARGGIDRGARAAAVELIERRTAHREIGALVVVTELERPAGGSGRMRPGCLRRLPLLQFVLRPQRGSDLEFGPDDLVDGPRTRQIKPASQAVIQQPEFLVLSLQIGSNGLHALLDSSMGRQRLENAVGPTRPLQRTSVFAVEPTQGGQHG